MKKTLALLSLGALFAAASAQAQVDLYITGSTAFRANAYRSIRLLFQNATNSVLISQNPADPASGQNQVTWSGRITNLFGSQTVTVRASYSGSVAGIQALAQNTSQTYLLNATPGDTATVSHQADLAFSDVFQTSTIFQSPALSDFTVGVLPFAYVKSSVSPAAFTNITIQQLQAFMPNGLLPASYFTGNTNDTATDLYLVGRDSGSGTRLTAQADSLFVGSPLLWGTNGSCGWIINSGYSSGSGVAGVLNSGCGAAVGYLGLSDAATVNGGANILRYDGTLPFNGTVGSPDFSPVRNGVYSFWCYEHLFSRTGANANITAYRNALFTEIDKDVATSTSAVQTSTMQVTRSADGGPITP
jgi:hypothetical protein